MKVFKVLLSSLIISLFASCAKDKTPEPETESVSVPEITIDNTTDVLGYGILSQLPGIWNGPVTSPTPLGSFPEWIVDFRPISSAQVSAKNELDSLNDIFMSFFIVKYNNEFKMAFRNGGGFAGSQRNSYMLIDSVSETSSQSFYRFVDFIAGKDRVYTDVIFKNDSLIMHAFTNVFNTLSTTETHMLWKASLKDTTSTQTAISLFNFPQKEMVKDFSTTFDGLTESVFYSAASDPYPEGEQPYLGNTTITVNITNPTTYTPGTKTLILISTQPLFSGFTFLPGNLDFRSRYVFVDAQATTSFNFNYMHPGDYYLNAVYDATGDLSLGSGDYINYPFDVPFSLADQGSGSATVNVSFQIP